MASEKHVYTNYEVGVVIGLEEPGCEPCCRPDGGSVLVSVALSKLREIPFVLHVPMSFRRDAVLQSVALVRCLCQYM